MIREIPKEDWQNFLISFSRLHSNWLVDVECGNIQLHQAPLTKLAVSGSDIDLKVGENIVTIQKPFRICLQQTDEGADEVLEIASPGQLCRIRFKSPTLPEMVDGVP
ncbi:DUF5335 domain-containing protein [bacterium]|nr:DUF5335 domain-containing protein [bacterium]